MYVRTPTEHYSTPQRRTDRLQVQAQSRKQMEMANRSKGKRKKPCAARVQASTKSSKQARRSSEREGEGSGEGKAGGEAGEEAGGNDDGAMGEHDDEDTAMHITQQLHDDDDDSEGGARDGDGEQDNKDKDKSKAEDKDEDKDEDEDGDEDGVGDGDEAAADKDVGKATVATDVKTHTFFSQFKPRPKKAKKTSAIALSTDGAVYARACACMMLSRLLLVVRGCMFLLFCRQPREDCS